MLFTPLVANRQGEMRLIAECVLHPCAPVSHALNIDRVGGGRLPQQVPYSHIEELCHSEEKTGTWVCYSKRLIEKRLQIREAHPKFFGEARVITRTIIKK